MVFRKETKSLRGKNVVVLWLININIFKTLDGWQDCSKFEATEHPSRSGGAAAAEV